MFGIYDKAQLQRGFQVYREVCSTCHALSIPFRTLADPGGPGFTEDQVKTLAATYQVTNAEPNDKGEIFKRPGDARPTSSRAPKPIRTTRPRPRPSARRRRTWTCSPSRCKYERGFPWFVFDALPGLEYQEMGADYIHAILTGYTKPDDPQWNLYYPGHKIAMPQPITDGAVDYKDGTPPTLDNYSKDVAAFLTWAAEPNLRRAQENWPPGHDLPVRVRGAALLHQEAGLGVGALRARRPRGRRERCALATALRDHGAGSAMERR